MTREEAEANIGQPFRWKEGGTGICGKFDIIKKVTENGMVCGEFLRAHHDDCRLKQEQPDHLKKHKDESISTGEHAQDN